MQTALQDALGAEGGLGKQEEDFLGGSSGEDDASSSEDLSDMPADEDGGPGTLGVAHSSDGDEDFGSADDGVEDGVASGSGSDSEGEDVTRVPAAASRLGDKSASFSRAFAKIMDAPTNGAVAEAGAAPILAASKSLAKRRAEEEAEQLHDREAKRLRQEMKRRGHVLPCRRGSDPAADAREKALQRLATKGVVRLFNAVAKAQKQLREAEAETGSKVRAAKLGKASFLAELKGAAAAAGAGTQALVPSAPSRGGGMVNAMGSGKKMQGRQVHQTKVDSSDDEGAGWDVLKQGFSGLQGGSKMKDWDKMQSEDEGGDDGGLGQDSSSDGDGD